MSAGPEWSYHVTVQRDDWEDIQRWCEETIGAFNDTWYKLGIDPASYVLYGYTQTTWYFKHERDAVMFRLKWL